MLKFIGNILQGDSVKSTIGKTSDSISWLYDFNELSSIGSLIFLSLK